MHDVKTQLLTDTFQYTKPASGKRKRPSGANSTRSSKPKESTAPKKPVQKQISTKAPKPSLTQEEKRERRRSSAAEHSQQRKELGLCKSCPSKAIEGQTRCPDCAAKHRVWLQQYSEKRRRAQGVKPRPRVDAEMLVLIQEEITVRDAHAASQPPKRVRSEAYKRKIQQNQAQKRAERISRGLCVDCGSPSLENQTRCADCVLKHR